MVYITELEHTVLVQVSRRVAAWAVKGSTWRTDTTCKVKVMWAAVDQEASSEDERQALMQFVYWSNQVLTMSLDALGPQMMFFQYVYIVKEDTLKLWMCFGFFLSVTNLLQYDLFLLS